MHPDNSGYEKVIRERMKDLDDSYKEERHENSAHEMPAQDADNGPSEPKDRKVSGPSILRWVVFILLIAYALISHYRAPLLTRMGSYLIVAHPLKKADVIVCMMGGSVERGLAAAEAFGNGLAPKIFIGREELPDGIEVLEEKGATYPESRDLLITMLQQLGVPTSSFITSEQIAKSTFEEAQIVKEMLVQREYDSMIIVTSPFHTRRTWLSFKKVFEEDDVDIMMLPTKYSNFSPDNWWKTRRYVRDVLFEYQKLIYYKLKYF